VATPACKKWWVWLVGFDTAKIMLTKYPKRVKSTHPRVRSNWLALQFAQPHSERTRWLRTSQKHVYHCGFIGMFVCFGQFYIVRPLASVARILLAVQPS
jgi:uncharacterized membrane protein YdcZ (DUF606 family)